MSSERERRGKRIPPGSILQPGYGEDAKERKKKLYKRTAEREARIQRKEDNHH